MSYSYSLVAQKDLARGLDLRSSESALADGYSEELQNVTCSSSGFISKRPGYQGYAGYVPFRVRQISHDGYQINMRLENTVDLTGLASSPLLVYGKISQAESGDYSTTDVLKSYASFSVDIRDTFSVSATTTSRSAVTDGLTSDDLFVFVMTSTSDGNNSNSAVIVDSVTVTTAYDVTITYVPPATERAFIAVVDKSAFPGTSYVADYSGSPISPSGGVVSGTILASTHGLSNFNIIPKLYTLSGSTYTEFIPDTFTINQTTGDVAFSFSSASNFDGQIILAVPSADNSEQQSVGAGSTATITVTGIDTNFPYWAMYQVAGGTKTLTIPDSVVVDDAADTITVSVVNASTSSALFEFYYDFATIRANTLRVVDTSATSTSYTGTFVTDPQLTVWGIDHQGKYGAASRGGHVLHLDSYRREAEGRLVSGLGGSIYAARTKDEVGSTYNLPELMVDLDYRISGDANLAPLFQVTGTSSSVRSRGIITADNVSSGYAVCSSATYVSSGVADYVISLTNKSGTLALNTQVTTLDYLTVTGMAHSVHNGTFKIVSIPAQDASSVTVRVENSALTLADFDETGSAGSANVFTDRFTTSVRPNYIAGDIIEADSIEDDLTLTVTGVSSSVVYVSGVTEEINLASGVTIFGKRTSYVHSLRNAAATASVSGLVRGDMVTATNYLGEDLARSPRVVYLNPFQDMTCTITVASSVATAVVGSDVTISSINTGTDLFTTSTAHGYTTNDPVVLSSTGSLPTGLRSDTIYYVSVQSSTTFKLTAIESGTVIDITSTGSGTITVIRAHNLSVGQRVILAGTGDNLLDGVRVVVSTPTRGSFTYATTSTTASASGYMVGRTAEFDESLTFTDALTAPTTLEVGARWIPVEAPSTTGDLPPPTRVTYFDDTTTNLRSVVVGGSMFFVNQIDEVMKFDGESIYQAGLFRWQPQLFVQVDTGTGILKLDAVSGGVTGATGNKFTVGTGEAIQFVKGERIVHSADSAIYTVQSADVDNDLVYTTTTITGAASGTIKKVKTYKYYFRLNAIDANNNIVASAATGADDFKVELATAGQIRMRLIGMPAWGVYDYDRIELQVYRVEADTPAPFYLIRSVPVSFNAGASYIDVFDATEDESIVQAGNLDFTMSALLPVGSELGTAWEQPPRAKYLTSVNNRLILGNCKDYPQLDVVIRPTATAASVTVANLSGQTFLFRKDSTDTATTTNNVDRVKFQFVSSGAVTITPANITRTATTFTIPTASPPAAGSWVYLFHAAVGVDNDLHFAGWFQVSSVVAGTSFTVNFVNSYTPSAADVDRFVTASTATDVPVWLGTDGNYNTRLGNTSGSYEFHAALRLANAINATQVATDTTLAPTFVPWLTANAGSEYALGQVLVRQPKYLSTTMEVELGTIGSNYDLYVNDIKRTASTAVAAQTKIFPSRVVISYQNSPEIFDAPAAALQEDSDSVVDVNSADGEEITGLVSFFGESAFGQSSVESLVVVFKTNSIYLLDVKTKQIQKLDTQGLGCTVPYSIAPTRNGIMFANLSGVYRVNRNLTISYVGKFIERYWRDTVNLDQIAVATGHNYSLGRQYKLSVPVSDDSNNSAVLVYDHTREGQDQEFGAWTRYTNHPATAWANLDNDAYFATTAGQVFKVRTANDKTDFRDDAAAVDQMVIAMKSMDAGLPGVRKRGGIVMHVRMDKSNVTGATIYAAVDNNSTYEEVDTITATLGDKKVETFRVSLPTPKFTYVQLKITDSTKDENFILAGVDFRVAALTDKGVKEQAELS